MKIRKSVKAAMKQLHIKGLRHNQPKLINNILDGNDTMIIAPTSFGKSLVYIIPAIIWRDKLTLVIEPLTSLMHDQVEKLQKLNVSAAYLDSTQSDEERKAVIKSVLTGKTHMLYISPERLETGILSQIEKHCNIGMIVIDECHCVTLWGSSFRDAYLAIGEYIDALKYHPVIVALTATAPQKDRDKIMKLLSMKNADCFAMSLYRSELSFLIQRCHSRKEQQKSLKRLMKKYHRNTTIVFCSTRHAAEHVVDYLDGLYPGDVAVYHSRNKKCEKAMLSGEKTIIVATTALSMGVDIPDVDLVIHFNMPMSPTEYYQMAGRGGRNGQHSRSILLYNPDDYWSNRVLLENIEDDNARNTALCRLDEMKEICEEKERCIVSTILESLGDKHNKRCRFCSSCQKARRR